MRTKLFALLALAAILVSACGQAATPAPVATQPPPAPATQPPAAKPRRPTCPPSAGPRPGSPPYAAPGDNKLLQRLS